MPDVTPAECTHRIATRERHRALHFRTQQQQCSFYAGLPAGRQRKQVAAPDTAGSRAQRQRLDDVVAAPDAAVADDFQAVAQGVSNCRDAVDGCRRRFQLTSAVIRQHDRARSRLRRLAAIFDRLHALDHERTGPAPREPLDVFPRQ